jgi:hypothetical protein
MRMSTASVAFVMIIAAGCSGGSKHSAPQPSTPPTLLNAKARAEKLCRGTVPDPEHLVSSEPTTIGAIRGVTVGTIGPAQTRSFAPLKNSDFGAWCWTLSGGTYIVYKAAGPAAIALNRGRRARPRRQ